MTCPACKPDAQCSACLAEELARRGQDHNLLSMLTKRIENRRGRPKKPKSDKLVSLHVSVHPQFMVFPAFLAAAKASGRGEAIEQAFGFTRPTTGQPEKAD